MYLTQTLLNPLLLLLTTEFSAHPLISHHLLLSSSQSNQFPPSTSYMISTLPEHCNSGSKDGGRQTHQFFKMKVTRNVKWQNIPLFRLLQAAEILFF